jgi:hypothetical protein
MQRNVGEVCIFDKNLSPRSLRLCAMIGPRGFWLRLAALRLSVFALNPNSMASAYGTLEMDGSLFMSAM